jgi:hypothetical protein
MRYTIRTEQPRDPEPYFVAIRNPEADFFDLKIFCGSSSSPLPRGWYIFAIHNITFF